MLITEVYQEGDCAYVRGLLPNCDQFEARVGLTTGKIVSDQDLGESTVLILCGALRLALSRKHVPEASVTYSGASL